MEQIPSEIAEIIKQKRTKLLEEKRLKEESDRRAEQEAEQKGKAVWNTYVEASLALVPEWIRPYCAGAGKDVDFVRIANNWDRPNNYQLEFRIPGMPEIVFNPEKKTWKAPYAAYDPYYDEALPEWAWSHSSWYDNLEYVLVALQNEISRMENFQAAYQKHQEEVAERDRQKAQKAEQESQEHDDIQSEAQASRQQEKAEEQNLLDALKNDPVAVAMLKAFLLIRQERSGFEAQLEGMNSSLYSTEEYWSGKAAELRRQSEAAQRRAEDEKARLQNDLDDAEAKLKKAERGW